MSRSFTFRFVWLVGVFWGQVMFGVPAHAGLQWEATTVKADGSGGQDRVTAEFRFKNAGSQEVTIASVHPSCGCTTSALSKTRFAASEAGVLTVLFTVGERTGMQRKTIEVQEEGEKVPTVLTLEVSLPEPLKVVPLALEWKKGEASVTRDIEVSALSGVNLGEVESTLPLFEIGTRKTREGAWTISIRPKASDAPTTALLRVHFSGRSNGAVVVPLRIR